MAKRLSGDGELDIFVRQRGARRNGGAEKNERAYDQGQGGMGLHDGR
jgi:hypothetical protein